jgi:hypothetical protein
MNTLYIVRSINNGITHYLRNHIHPECDYRTMEPGRCEIFDVRLFRFRADAENAIDQLSHGVAKTCEIVPVTIG